MQKRKFTDILGEKLGRNKEKYKHLPTQLTTAIKTVALCCRALHPG